MVKSTKHLDARLLQPFCYHHLFFILNKSLIRSYSSSSELFVILNISASFNPFVSLLIKYAYFLAFFLFAAPAPSQTTPYASCIRPCESVRPTNFLIQFSIDPFIRIIHSINASDSTELLKTTVVNHLNLRHQTHRRGIFASISFLLLFFLGSKLRRVSLSFPTHASFDAGSRIIIAYS